MGITTQMVSLLLVLDFSGSMEQKINADTKSVQLTHQARAVLSALPPQERVHTVLFGSNPSAKCNDFKSLHGNPQQATAFIEHSKPGAYGKTPLARTLRNMRTWSREMKGQLAVLITDGADTCHEDPCQALHDLDQSLRKDKKNLNLIMVGYDLKDDEKKLACLKSAKTKNIQLKFLTADQPWQLQKALSEAFKNIQNKETSTGLQIPSQKSTQSPRSSTKNGTTLPAETNAASQTNSQMKGPSTIHVGGASATDLFEIFENNNKIKDWYGGLPTKLPPGSYQIRYQNPNGKTLSVILGDLETRHFVLADFLIQPAANQTLLEGALGVELTPSGLTSESHRDLRSLVFAADLSQNNLILENVPLGTWTLKVIAPEWLKNRLPDQTLNVQIGSPSIDLVPVIREKITWIKNEKPEKQRVLELSLPGGRVESHLIPSGVLRLPVVTGDQYRWLL